MDSLNFVDATEQNMGGAVQFLKRNGAKLGITRFCLGGVVTVIASAKIFEFSAAAPFYCIPPEYVVKPAEVRIPLQGHFALKDTWITPTMVDTFDTGLKKSGNTYEIFRCESVVASCTSICWWGFLRICRPNGPGLDKCLSFCI